MEVRNNKQRPRQCFETIRNRPGNFEKSNEQTIPIKGTLGTKIDMSNSVR